MIVAGKTALGAGMAVGVTAETEIAFAEILHSRAAAVDFVVIDFFVSI